MRDARKNKQIVAMKMLKRFPPLKYTMPTKASRQLPPATTEYNNTHKHCGACAVILASRDDRGRRSARIRSCRLSGEGDTLFAGLELRARVRPATRAHALT